MVRVSFPEAGCRLVDNYIEGKNSVLEALRSGRTIEKIYVLKESGSHGEIVALAKEAGVAVAGVTKAKLDEMSDTRKHQGVLAIVSPFQYASPEDILARARSRNEQPLIVILDHIEDPHNLGAIIRTAETAGAHGVIIPNRRAAQVTPAAEKAAAGAASYVHVAKVANIAACVEELKKEGVWVFCTAREGIPLYESDMSGPIALVIGSEGGGVSPLVRKKCDVEVSIPMLGKITSLNASVATGIALYEVVRRRGFCR